MSRFFYGSSNVYRHYSCPGHGIDLSLVQCTQKAVFDAHLATLGTVGSGSLIVTSVLENFVSTACRGLEDAEVELFANQQITAHVESLADVMRASPDSAGHIVPLFDRKIPGWCCIFIFAKEEKRENNDGLFVKKSRSCHL